MSGIEEMPALERGPELRRRLRRTAWIIAAVITALSVGSAWYMAKNGRKSRTVLHSELRLEGAQHPGGVSSWT
jgi:hypothetical protein